MDLYTHTCTNIYIHVEIYIYTYIYIYIHTYVHTYIGPLNVFFLALDKLVVTSSKYCDIMNL